MKIKSIPNATRSGRPTKSPLVITFLIFFFVLAAEISFAQSATSFKIKISDKHAFDSVSGRLLVFVSTRNRRPINGPSWFGPEPFFAKDVADVKPGDSIVIDDSANCFPAPLSKLPNKTYYVQAILDHDFYKPNHAAGVGNFFSKAEQIDVNGKPIEIVLDQVVKEQKITESPKMKMVEVKSDLLSKFHDREVIEKALVVLPASYGTQMDRRYPVYYEITGFGGTYTQLARRWSRGQSSPREGQTEFIRVVLTGQCKWGHHVYANSATNGPRGDALIEEMIPEIDRRFRTIPKPTARFLGGHSSGGWSSLWLQVTYPDFFGGVWSTAPDPVDFRNWQGTDLYSSGANVYFDNEGNKKPLARFGDRIMAYYKDFTDMDDTLGRGGQIRSFDAVFSPTGPDGQPTKCWDRETGTVNTEVLEHWKKYDISLLLKSNWDQLAPRLKSKIHVMMGDTDTFYLEGATIKLRERLKELGSDADIEIFAGKDHSSLMTPALRRRITTEMSEQFFKHHPKM